MKRFKLSTLIFTAAIALMTSLPQLASAEWYTNQINIPSGLSTVSNATTTSTSGTAFDVVPNTDILILPSASAANAGTSNLVYGFDVTNDKSHWSTTAPLLGTNALNGTTAVSGPILITKEQLKGVQQIRFGSISTTQTNLVTIAALYAAWFR